MVRLGVSDPRSFSFGSCGAFTRLNTSEGRKRCKNVARGPLKGNNKRKWAGRGRISCYLDCRAGISRGVIFISWNPELRKWKHFLKCKCSGNILLQQYHNSLNDFYQLLGLVILSDNTVHFGFICKFSFVWIFLNHSFRVRVPDNHRQPKDGKVVTGIYYWTFIFSSSLTSVFDQIGNRKHPIFI